jgi:hypothetical protein
MPLELRQMTVPATRPHDPVGYVEFFAGDGADAERSEQWITGQVPVGLPAMKSLALLQIVVLQRAQDLPCSAAISASSGRHGLGM